MKTQKTVLFTHALLCILLLLVLLFAFAESIHPEEKGEPSSLQEAGSPSPEDAEKEREEESSGQDKDASSGAEKEGGHDDSECENDSKHENASRLPKREEQEENQRANSGEIEERREESMESSTEENLENSTESSSQEDSFPSEESSVPGEGSENPPHEHVWVEVPIFSYVPPVTETRLVEKEIEVVDEEAYEETIWRIWVEFSDGMILEKDESEDMTAFEDAVTLYAAIHGLNYSDHEESITIYHEAVTHIETVLVEEEVVVEEGHYEMEGYYRRCEICGAED